MFIRMTFVRFKPGTMPDVQALYNDVVIPKMKQQPGLRFVHFLEQVDDRNAGISITAWDTSQEAEAYERTGIYPQLLANFEKWYAAPPELRRAADPARDDPSGTRATPIRFFSRSRLTISNAALTPGATSRDQVSECPDGVNVDACASASTPGSSSTNAP